MTPAQEPAITREEAPATPPPNAAQTAVVDEEAQKRQIALTLRQWIQWWDQQINALTMPPSDREDKYAPIDDLKRKANDALAQVTRHKKHAAIAQKHDQSLAKKQQEIVSVLNGETWPQKIGRKVKVKTLQEKLTNCADDLKTTDLATLQQARDKARQDKDKARAAFTEPATGADILGKKSVFAENNLGERISEMLENGKYRAALKKLDKQRNGRFARKKLVKWAGKKMVTGFDPDARDQVIDQLKAQVGTYKTQAERENNAEIIRDKVENETVRAVQKLLKQERPLARKARALFDPANATAQRMAKDHDGVKMLMDLAGRDARPDKHEVRQAVQDYGISLDQLQQDVRALREKHQTCRQREQQRFEANNAKYTKMRAFVRDLRTRRNTIMKATHGNTRSTLVPGGTDPQDGDALEQALAENNKLDTLKRAEARAQKQAPDAGKMREIALYTSKLAGRTSARKLPANPLSWRKRSSDTLNRGYAATQASLSRTFQRLGMTPGNATQALGAAANALNPRKVRQLASPRTAQPAAQNAGPAATA